MVAHIRQQPRRSVTFLTAATFLVVALLLAVGSSGPAHATSGGSPYEVPLVVDTNSDPNIVETTIVAQEADIDIGNGVTAHHALTFNGSVPGPEFRLNVGDTVIVHFENQLHHATGIHWHGIELANGSDGTPLTQDQVAPVPPGGTFLYKFQVTRPGVYWYHPHHHSSTNQVFKGLYGSIIVTAPYEQDLVDDGVLPSDAQTETLVLSDITVCKASYTAGEPTYDLTLPWAGGGALPAQPGPTAENLCRTPMDEEGDPIVDGSSTPIPLAAGEIPNIQPNTGLRVNEGQTVLTNGKNVGGRSGSPDSPGALAAGASTLDVQAGQGLRLQIVNTATTRFFRLRLTDDAGAQVPLVRVGGQGGLLDSAVVEGGTVGDAGFTAGDFDFKYHEGEILLDPGDRADVVAAIPATAVATDVLTLWTQDFDRTGQTFTKIPTVPVMHLNVTGTAPGSPYTIGAGTSLRAAAGAPAVEVLGPATDTLLDPASFSPIKLGMPNQDIQITQGGGVPGDPPLSINGVPGHHDFPPPYTAAPHLGSTRYAELGDTLQLTVTNTTVAHHPFHLHGFSIQPLTLTKSGSPTYTYPPEFVDNIDIPKGYTLTFRVRLDDRPLLDGTTPGGALGRWVFHCHIFFHATLGMISEFVVVDPDAAAGNERPYVNANDATVEIDEGDTATMSGTYADPDGDPVTLTGPSIGTFTDNGDGTWDWTSTVGPSQLLYVTATDDEGNQDQAVFELIFNGLAPTITDLTSNSPQFEGSPVLVEGSATDPGSDPLTAEIDWGDGTVEPLSGTFDAGPPATLDFAGSHVYADNGTYPAEVCVSDGTSETCQSLSIEVLNAAPEVGAITAPTGPVSIGTLVETSAPFTDPGTGDTHSAEWDWGDGTTSPGVVTETNGSGTVTGSHTYTSSDLYTVTLTVTDDDLASDVAVYEYVIVFDPARSMAVNAKINSPAGAYLANPAKTGFAYSTAGARYKFAPLVASGGATFQFSAVPFYFNASNLEWLVVALADGRGYLKGTGSVNGVPGYSFLLSVFDGTPDKYRMKVWNTTSSAVVYDSQFGAPLAAPANIPLLAGSVTLN